MKSTAEPTVIHKITPESIGVDGATRYATVLHKGQIYLSLLHFDDERGKDLRKVLRWNPANGQWTTLLNEILSEKYPERRPLHPVTADGSLLTSTRLLITPDVAGHSRLEVDFFSPCGHQRWRLNAGATALESVEPDSAPSFISWQIWKENLYAIVEDAEGNRSITTGSKTLPAPGAGMLASLLVFNDELFVSVNNLKRGFGLWKLADSAETWQPVLIEGALRFLLNPDLHAAVPWDGNLLLAAGVSDPAKRLRYDKYYYSGGFELLLLQPDGDWEILIGTTRPSPQGLKVPVAFPAETFDNLLSPRFRALVATDDRLILCAESDLGYHAWESFDGLEWSEIWRDAFTTWENITFASQYSTPAGPVFVMETRDFEKRSTLEFWLAAPEGGPAFAPEPEQPAPRRSRKKAKKA